MGKKKKNCRPIRKLKDFSEQGSHAPFVRGSGVGQPPAQSSWRVREHHESVRQSGLQYLWAPGKRLPAGLNSYPPAHCESRNSHAQRSLKQPCAWKDLKISE